MQALQYIIERRLDLMKEEKIQKQKTEENYTYMVRCKDGSFYIGWTNHLEKRIEAHNSGNGAKYTKSRRPVELVYYETFRTKQEAMSREYHLKQLTHEQKQELLDKTANNCYANQRCLSK